MSRVLVVIDLVAGYFSLTRSEILSERRLAPLARARQIAMWICRHETPLSLPVIGRAFNRDHTTVMHACTIVDEQRERDELFKEVTDKLRDKARLRQTSPVVTPDQKATIERYLETQRQALMRMAVVNPILFDRRYGGGEATPAEIERAHEGQADLPPAQVEEAMGAV